MDKKDLEELDRLEYEREQEQFEKYGIDLRKVNRKAVSKKSNKLAKIFKRIGYLLTSSTILILVLGILAILSYLCIQWSNLYERSNINVQKSMEAQYGIKLQLISKETSGHTENGKYYFQTKDEPHIKFMAKKYYGNYSSDFSDKIVKYYFESWNSSSKEYFIVSEKIENELLDYGICIDFKKCKDIDEAGKIFIEFVKFCGDAYKPYWDVCIKLDANLSNRLYPSVNPRASYEDNLEEIRHLYSFHLWFKNKSNDLNNSLNEPIPIDSAQSITN